MAQRVVITGMGAITSLGEGADVLWSAMLGGRSGIGPLRRLDAAGCSCQIGAEILEFDPARWLPKKELRHMDRFAQFGAAAARMAVAESGLDMEACDRDRVGVTFGTGIGGMETFVEQFQILLERGPDRVSPFFVPKMIANMAAGQISILLGARGPNETLVTACASSANAIGDAFRLIQRGDADVMITGGAEAVFTKLTFAGFCAMRALSTRNDEPQRASRPFDADRDGFVLGEGAGAVVLERLDHALARGAKIRGELIGYGMAADAYDVVHPAPGGVGAARAMRAALADAGLQPADIDYVNAHATSTHAGDREECRALQTVFGDHLPKLPVSSTKSVTGHLLGAAGAVELIASALAVETGWLPPTVNFERPDPDCPIDCVPNTPRRAPEARVALSNSFGFGGQNACLLVRRWEPAA
ncbi:MAG TPA: beta-ketoacyl-ACP synthase II [Bacillota bacterium]|nr:beta-ketoacyl-ACP synthase II [Bacillota bacterium]